MQDQQGRLPTAVTREDPRLDDPTAAVDHLVCCRGTWERALCGQDTAGDYLSVVVDRLCPMCVEEAKQRLARFSIEFPPDPPRCPEDGSLCPGDAELDQRIDEFLSS